MRAGAAREGGQRARAGVISPRARIESRLRLLLRDGVPRADPLVVLRGAAEGRAVRGLSPRAGAGRGEFWAAHPRVLKRAPLQARGPPLPVELPRELLHLLRDRVFGPVEQAAVVPSGKGAGVQSRTEHTATRSETYDGAALRAAKPRRAACLSQSAGSRRSGGRRPQAQGAAETRTHQVSATSRSISSGAEYACAQAGTRDASVAARLSKQGALSRRPSRPPPSWSRGLTSDLGTRATAV